MAHVLLVLLALVAVVAPPTGATGTTFVKNPEVFTIDLPLGQQPEKVTKGPGNTLLVGLLTGGIYRIDFDRDNALEEVISTTESVVGIDYSPVRDFIVGTDLQRIFFLKQATGELVANCTVEGAVFINDVIIYRGFAYFTDSRRSVLYKLSLWNAGKCRVMTKSVDIPSSESTIGPNGITTFANKLLVVQSTLGNLYEVDLKTFDTRLVLRGGVTFGDGLAVRKNILYVARNRLDRIEVFRLRSAKGRISAKRLGRIESDEFRVPTTVALFSDKVCVCNARFGRFDPAEIASEDFDVVCLPPFPKRKF
mmetsp:Transcript_4053/g.12182  ORF Transcript_4053/g.12182 Transcript_4053/m.12182 type:complete len:308 (-) Transcript_4053:149-1072(-)